MKKLICIVCPNGCNMEVDENGNVSGAKCKRGNDFAKQELTLPMRSLTTTVKTCFVHQPVLPVRTDAEIPKSQISNVINALARVQVKAPLRCGDIVVKNILNLNSNIIATTNLTLKGE